MADDPTASEEQEEQEAAPVEEREEEEQAPVEPLASPRAEYW
jgi:hypothetical protein